MVVSVFIRLKIRACDNYYVKRASIDKLWQPHTALEYLLCPIKTAVSKYDMVSHTNSSKAGISSVSFLPQWDFYLNPWFSMQLLSNNIWTHTYIISIILCVTWKKCHSIKPLKFMQTVQRWILSRTTKGDYFWLGNHNEIVVWLKRFPPSG